MRKKKQQKLNNQNYQQLSNFNCFLFDADYYRYLQENECLRKLAYDSEWQAKVAADEQYQLNKVVLDWYQCNYCGKWHLTSNKL